MKLQPLAPALLPQPVDAPASIAEETISTVAAQLGQSFVEGAAVLMTARVDVVNESTVPLLAILAGLDVERLSFLDRAAVVATDPATRTTYVGRWSEWDEPDPDAERPEPDPEVMPAHTVLAFRGDLRDQLPDLPWTPSTLRVRVLLGEWASPSTTVALTADPFLADPAVVAFLRDRTRTLDPLPHETSPTMWLTSDPALLQPPADGGILAKLPAVAFAGGEEPLPLDLAFLLPLLAHERLGPTLSVPVDAQGRPLGARVSLSIVITGEQLVDPAIVRVAASAYVVQDSAASAPWGWARLTLDLNALPSMPRPADRYQVRVFAGEYESEAMPLTLVPTNLRIVRPKAD